MPKTSPGLCAGLSHALFASAPNAAGRGVLRREGGFALSRFPYAMRACAPLRGFMQCDTKFAYRFGEENNLLSGLIQGARAKNKGGGATQEPRGLGPS